jgi:hypothetical protein
VRAHLSAAEIRRLLDGTSSRQAAEAAFGHAAGCASCRDALARRPDDLGDGRKPAYDRAIDRAFTVALEADRAAARERSRAQELLRSLLSGRREGAELSEAQLDGLDGLPRIEALLAESWRQRHRDSRRMVRFAELARLGAERLDPGLYGHGLVADFQALALAELGNAFRVADDFGRAEELLDRAMNESERGTGDLRLIARIADLTSSLLGARGQFASAVRILGRVEKIYEGLGETALAGRALISQGIYTGRDHEPEKALALLAQGLERIDPEKDPELVFHASHNQIGFLADCGRYRQARILLWKSRARYAGMGGRLNLLRMGWLEGRIALGLADFARAERCLAEARHGLMAADQIYDAALAGMDLATVWLVQKRIGEIERLARETQQLFEELGAAQEAVALMAWLWQSSQRGRVTHEFLEGVAFYLKELGPRLVRRQGNRAAG